MSRRASSGAGGAQFGSLAATGRQAASLGVLTRRFLELLKGYSSQKVDLNDISRILGVQKRRVYDITNVLEGIGMLDKLPKGCIFWRGNDVPVDPAARAEASRLRDQVISMQEEEQRVDEYFRRIRASMRRQTQLPGVRRALYLTTQDMERVVDRATTTAIAVRGEEGTRLLLHDPARTVQAGQQHYRVELRSRHPVSVVLVADEDGGDEGTGEGAEGDGGGGEKGAVPAPTRHAAVAAAAAAAAPGPAGSSSSSSSSSITTTPATTAAAAVSEAAAAMAAMEASASVPPPGEGAAAARDVVLGEDAEEGAAAKRRRTGGDGRGVRHAVRHVAGGGTIVRPGGRDNTGGPTASDNSRRSSRLALRELGPSGVVGRPFAGGGDQETAVSAAFPAAESTT